MSILMYIMSSTCYCREFKLWFFLILSGVLLKDHITRDDKRIVSCQIHVEFGCTGLNTLDPIRLLNGPTTLNKSARLLTCLSNAYMYKN